MLFSTGCYSSEEYDNDLLSKDSGGDIMKVFTPVRIHETLDLKAEVELLWERPTYTELFDALEGK